MITGASASQPLASPLLSMPDMSADPTVPVRPVARNTVTVLGVVLTTITALLFLAVLAADAFGLHANPYLGAVFFVVLPGVFLVGLGLIPLGVWRERRRRRRGLPPSLHEWPRLDLSHPRTRAIAFAVVVLTPANLAIVGMAGYKGVEYMDSTAFCGEVCHEVMEPEYVAHQSGPHSNVACAECHVGPGAAWFVRAKVSGVRRVVALLTNSHARPVPAPVEDLRPARDTCQQCHAPTVFHGDRQKVVTEYAADEANTPSATTLTLHLGGTDASGTARGIHWHAAPGTVVEYIAADTQRQTIPYVRLVAADGQVREYFAEGVTARPAGEVRRMDCLDCHNRPTHIFERSAERALNTLLADGAAPADLPFLKRESLAAITAAYPSGPEGQAAVGQRLGTFYREQYPALWTSRRADIDRAGAAVAALYRRNVFPAMRVTWGVHPDHRGHMEFPGCFRCHDDGHTTATGQVIKQDCDLCHDVS